MVTLHDMQVQKCLHAKQLCIILLTAALLKLKVFLAILLACLARELLSMQGKLVNNKQTFSETKLL